MRIDEVLKKFLFQVNDLALFLELQCAKMPEEVSFSRHQRIQQKSDLSLHWSHTITFISEPNMSPPT